MALNGGTVYYQCVKDHPNCDTPCEGCCAADPADCVPPGTYVEGEGVCDVGKTCYILEEDVPTCDEVGGTCRSFLCNTTPPNVETPYNGTTSDCNGQDRYCCIPDTSWKCGTPGNECCPEPEDPCETFLYYCDPVTNTCVTNTCGLVSQECCLPPQTPCRTTDLECIDVSGIKTCVRVNIPKPPEMVYKGPIIESLEQVIGPVSKMLYYGGLAIGVFFIILSGYKLMTSEGDPQRVKAAQEQLTSAIVGIIFILLSVSIIRIIIEEIIVI